MGIIDRDEVERIPSHELGGDAHTGDVVTGENRGSLGEKVHLYRRRKADFLFHLAKGLFVFIQTCILHDLSGLSRDDRQEALIFLRE